MFHADAQSKLSAIRSRFNHRRKLVVVAIVGLVLGAGTLPAMAAPTPTVSFSTWNDVIFVNGAGFPGNTVIKTTAIYGDKAGQANVRTWPNGVYYVGFRLPANPKGTLRVEATGGGKSASATKTFGSANLETSPTQGGTSQPQAPATTAAPKAPATTTTTAAPKPTTPPTTPAPTSGAKPVGVTGSWNMIFSDEFNSSSVNRGVWPECHYATRPGCTGQNAEELQVYKPNNVTVSNGTAKLTAKKENTFVAEQNRNFGYSGASLATGPWNGNKSTFDFTYGYVEARMKTAPGKGVWSSLWMEPSSLSWPPEIDIMEHPNFNPNEVHSNLHYGTVSNHKQTGQTYKGPNFNQDFHTFGLEWTSTSLSWYIDGKKVRTLNDANIVPKVPMYLVANTSVGGWAGSPNGTSFPSSFEIDYIRVWQR